MTTHSRKALDTEGSTADVNAALVLGTMASEPEERVLPSGTRAVAFSLTVRASGAKTTSVPMVWFDPPKRFARLSVGDRVLARGMVVRRFYRAGGAGLGSATEVVVADAAKSDTAAARRIQERAAAAIECVSVGPRS